VGHKEIIVGSEKGSSSFKDDRHWKSSNLKSKKNIIKLDEYLRLK